MEVNERPSPNISPLKAIHQEWYLSSEQKHGEIDISVRKEWIEEFLFALFHGSSFCRDLEKPTRQTKCTCLAVAIHHFYHGLKAVQRTTVRP